MATLRRTSGACQRCGARFASDETVVIVQEDIAFGFLRDNMCIGVTPEWVAVCTACTTPAEAAAARHTISCRACGQEMATPHAHALRYKVCSERCAQRWRRRRIRTTRPLAICAFCGTGFHQTRA